MLDPALRQRHTCKAVPDDCPRPASSEPNRHKSRMSNPTYPLLDRIDSPADLRAMPESELPLLADELRSYLIETIGRVGGHFAGNLGTIELTLALHYVYDTPNDRLVWDVGHQTYPHKILTGRRQQIHTIRQHGGLAPFPKRAESPYDTFGVGHSSTSVSAALGMALAARNQGQSRRVAAIIGDGAMTAGMAYEALNHAGHLRADMLVILNDNEMSISPNVGGLNNYLTRLLSSQSFTSAREGSKRVLDHLPPVREFARRAEEHIKGMVTPGTLFEEMGFHYFGPVDGHDLPTLVQTLRNLRQRSGPTFLHIVTRKGKGYSWAEADPVKYHGVGAFDPRTGKMAPKGGGVSYTRIFSDWICDMAARDERLVGITPAMREGSGLVEFEQRFPERYHDTSIAEQHAVTLAAGMACDGVKPVVAIYSTFLQRAYDQVVHDVAVQNLPVLFALDRAGLVGADGPTHAGSFDVAMLRCLPNFTIMAPADENECRLMLSTGFEVDGPAAVRYPRGGGPGVEVAPGLQTLPVGKAEVRRHGRNLAILAFGTMVTPATEVAESLNATLVNMRFIKPLDEACVLEIARTHGAILTVEESAIAGGAGEAVSECLAAHELTCPLAHVGLPDRFVEHGSREDQLEDAGLTSAGILAAADKLLAQIPANHSGRAEAPAFRG